MDEDDIWLEPSDFEDVFEDVEDIFEDVKKMITYLEDHDYYPLPGLSEIEGDEEDPWDY